MRNAKAHFIPHSSRTRPIVASIELIEEKNEMKNATRSLCPRIIVSHEDEGPRQSPFIRLAVRLLRVSAHGARGARTSSARTIGRGREVESWAEGPGQRLDETPPESCRGEKGDRGI